MCACVFFVLYYGFDIYSRLGNMRYQTGKGGLETCVFKWKRRYIFAQHIIRPRYTVAV